MYIVSNSASMSASVSTGRDVARLVSRRARVRTGIDVSRYECRRNGRARARWGQRHRSMGVGGSSGGTADMHMVHVARQRRVRRRCITGEAEVGAGRVACALIFGSGLRCGGGDARYRITHKPRPHQASTQVSRSGSYSKMNVKSIHQLEATNNSQE